MEALKYALNCSSRINIGEVGGVGGCWGKLLMSWISAAGLLNLEIGWLSGKSTSAEGFIYTPTVRGGGCTVGLATTGSVSSGDNPGF